MKTIQDLLDQNLEEFTQLVLIALAKRAGGKIQLTNREIQEAFGTMLHIGQGSSGVALSVVVGAVPNQDRAKAYFERQRPEPSGSRVVVVAVPSGGN